MSKGKLEKFADMERFENVFQYPYSLLAKRTKETITAPCDEPFPMRGRWHEQYFHNNNPIVLELGCGKGEYTVGLARLHPDVNFIGVDIKGARMWSGAREALGEDLGNVAFLRTNIEIIDHFFSADEVQAIWLTFSDPQMKNPRKRLTSTHFLNRYRRFLTDGGTVHLKTDSNFLFTYTTCLIHHNRLPLLFRTDNLYSNSDADADEARAIQTYYENMWIQRGISIKYLAFSLPRHAELQEPDVEIPLDHYRSYHRNKRTPKTTSR